MGFKGWFTLLVRYLKKNLSTAWVVEVGEKNCMYRPFHYKISMIGSMSFSLWLNTVILNNAKFYINRSVDAYKFR